MEYCNYYNCFCDDEKIEKEQEERREECYIECQDCEWHEEQEDKL